MKRAPIKEISTNYRKSKSFLEKIQRSPECWIWKGPKMPNGYGRHSVYLAHRFSYFYFCGDIPKGKHILHKCDNRLCVNPDHLYPGTHTDNMRDMVTRKRSSSMYGEDNCLAKLNEEDIRLIRALGKKGLIQEKIAEIFSVSRRNISKILRKETWGHIS